MIEVRTEFRGTGFGTDNFTKIKVLESESKSNDLII